MAANNIPIFVLTPRVSGCTVSVANTNYDGTGTLGTVLAAGANGSRIDRVKIKCRGSSAAAGAVRFYTYDGVSAYRFLTEVLFPIIAASATVASFEQDVDLNLFLPTGYSLVCAPTVTQSMDVTPTIAGDF